MSQDPNQAAVSQFEALRSRFDTVYRDAGLTSISDKVNQISRDISDLPGKIAQARSRKYSFAAYLEHKAEVMAQRWNGIRADVTRTLDEESARLRQEVDRLRRRIDSADGLKASSPAALQSQLPDLERGLVSAESLLKDTQSRLENLYSTLASDVAQTMQQLTAIDWYLDQRDEASFPFLAEESLFLAAKAEWAKTGKGKDDPDGVLFLTDQRLIFEQKEKVGKKLGLFGGHKEQELEWEIPLNQVEAVKAENKGFLGGKDMLYFTLGSGAPYADITVEVKGGVACKFWAAQIDRMIKGETNDERAIQPDPETLEAIRSAPTACPSCGGTLPQLVASQRQIDCGYCGAVIRV